MAYYLRQKQIQDYVDQYFEINQQQISFYEAISHLHQKNASTIIPPQKPFNVEAMPAILTYIKRNYKYLTLVKLHRGHKWVCRL